MLLITTFTCLFALFCLAGSVVFVIHGPNPIWPSTLVSLCCYSFVLGMIANQQIARLQEHFRRLSDDSDSCQGG